MNINKPYHIYADEESLGLKTVDQFYSALYQDFAVKGALMPDAHLGYSLPIGAVIATKDIIVPAWIGYDIGCGMCAIHTGVHKSLISASLDEIYKSIYRVIPVGFNHHKEKQDWAGIKDVERTDIINKILNGNGLYQLGTLGGGNHFIEIGYDENDFVWVIVHSGSRNVGHSVATHYMKLASGDGKAREGHYGFQVDSVNGKDYIKDMNFCLDFALENRRKIIFKVFREIRYYAGVSIDDAEVVMFINRNHNHAELKDGLWIHRKGATHAENGMAGVIPGNMRDGSFIVKGKGNETSLCSSSHGAGRVKSRKQAKADISLESFSDAMKGIVARVSNDTIDESPMAYKNIFDVMEAQKDLVETIHYIKPIINVKG